MMRVVLSIKAGKVMPSTLLHKLGSYSKKNRLYQAFQELGKVVRTMFLLEYISSPKIRSCNYSGNKYCREVPSFPRLGLFRQGWHDY